MKLIPHAAQAAFFLSLVLSANAQEAITPQTTLLKSDRVTISKREFDIELGLAVPTDRQAGWLSSRKNISQLLESLLIMKTLAEDAKAAKLDADPEVQAEIALATQRVLARRQRAELDKKLALPDFEKRAREVYRTEPEKHQLSAVIDASHILVETKCLSPAAARERVQAAIAELKAGKPFAEVAEKYSDDPGSRAKGGRLGSQRADKLEKAFVEAAKQLKSGAYSEVVETPFGYHVILLHSYQPGESIPFDVAKVGIIDDLKQQFVKTHYSKYFGAIRDHPSVQIDEALLDRAVKAPTPAAPQK